MLDDDHKVHLNGLAIQVSHRLAAGNPLSLDEIAEGVISGRPENAGFRDLLKRTAGISARDFETAMRRKRVRDAIGPFPETAFQFVVTLVGQERIECRYDGTLVRVGARVATLPNGETVSLTSENMTDENMRTFAHILGGKTLRFSELQRMVRMRRDELGLDFSDAQIADATEEWRTLGMRDRLFTLYGGVAGPIANSEERERKQALLLDLAERCFDTSDTSPAFVAAALQKFVWQVKRKLQGKKVTSHLMLVLLGPQGIGKSTFVEGLTSPLKEVTAKVDFKMIADDRNIDLWANYVMFIDEMGYATMTDVDVIKNIITSDVLTRRPMRTNCTDVVPQNGTFIGCSNKELRQLVRDPTGLRRFVGLRFRRDADWDLINGTAWADLWRLVDANAEDPMLPFAKELRAQQEQDRYRSNVETWIDQFDRAEICGSEWDGDAVKAAILYRDFRDYEEVYHPGSRTGMTEWGTELSRLAEAQGSSAVFTKFRRSSGNWYRHRRATVSKMVVVGGGAVSAAA